MTGTAGPRDTVLVAAARTPVGRFNGALRGVDARSLGASAVAAAMDRLGQPVVPDRILLANIVQAGNGQNPARAAAVRAGLPTTVPGTTLNDVCLASMTSVSLARLMIGAGEAQAVLVGGFESMSRALHGIQVRQAARPGPPEVLDLLTNDGLWCAISDEGMGELSDDANAALGIGRAEQDEWALESHRRAAAAQAAGAFAAEIVPLPQLDADEGVRPDSSAEALARLRPAFHPDGTITAGNASQLSDAGAAGLVTSREYAARLGVAPLAEVLDVAMVAGPDPTLHLKPADAARRLLERNGLTVGDIGVWEVNEAFAGVVIATMRDLDLDPERVNLHGGAIAIGHPLAASGFRIVMSAVTTMTRGGSELGIATMCGGGGQGAAVLLRLPRG